ncbi:MAG: hypothetical protein FJZ95_01425, partial [Chloroflexi bacterium]|nr:hypothetical protein [Chloroflexota bacterium]
MRRTIAGLGSLVMVVLLLLATLGVSSAGAAGEPKRDIVFYADYTSIGVAAGQEISLDLTLDNKGDVAEDVALSIAAPEKWETTLTAWATKDAQVRSVHLEPAQESPKKLTLKTTIPTTAETGDYTITITAATRDLAMERSVDISIEVLEGGAAYTGPATVELKPDYPGLGAVPGGNVEFKIEVTNKSDEDKTFGFAAEVPAHIEAQFSPAFDRTKNISALEIKAGESQSIIMKLAVGSDVEQGTYQIVFKASSGEV